MKKNFSRIIENFINMLQSQSGMRNLTNVFMLETQQVDFVYVQQKFGPWNQ